MLIDGCSNALPLDGAASDPGCPRDRRPLAQGCMNATLHLPSTRGDGCAVSVPSRKVTPKGWCLFGPNFPRSGAAWGQAACGRVLWASWEAHPFRWPNGEHPMAAPRPVLSACLNSPIVSLHMHISKTRFKTFRPKNANRDIFSAVSNNALCVPLT